MMLWPFLLLAVIFVAFGIYLYIMQDKMVFFPTSELVITPDEVGLEYEDIFIEVAPGEKIHGWLFRTTIASDSKPTSVLLFCHGNGGNISHRFETIEYILGLGADIFIFDYRGYGQSDGSPSEENIYVDARACFDWLKIEGRYKSEQIVLFGRSLGGVVAIDLARQVPCRGLIVESSLTSARAMAAKMFPFFPISLLLRYHLNSLEKIGEIACPVLVTHSPEDEIIPYDMGKQLFATAKSPKCFVALRGGHNERLYFQDDAYRDALQELISGTAARW
ncbi:MAG: alpha/beta hydrolase [Candidatus Zixiibacteriota bacterium]|nr:MAG: alpha/beta hydrolase [candidate division Zixibacteria bacterium]